MLQPHIITEFEQLCITHPSLCLDDIFELDTKFISDEIYPYISELEKHFAKQEHDLWTDYFKQECGKKGLQNFDQLFYGQTEMRMSDAMKQFYFLMENPTYLDNIVRLTENNEKVRYHLVNNAHYISFQEELIETPQRKESFYALAVNQHSFELVEITRPQFLSYSYYVACQYSQMLRWTDLGDDVRKRVGKQK